MKKVLITICCLAITTIAAHAQDKGGAATTPPGQNATTPPAKVADPDAGEFKFKDKDDTHDYGTVPEGPDAEYDFDFKNVGKKPIVISGARGSCGCTVPTWPHDPILPGKKGTIHVTYHTDHRSGPISKEVIITSNAKEETKILHIRGNVTPKPAETKPADPKATDAPKK